MGQFKAKAPRTGFTRPSTDATKVDRHWKTVKIKDLEVNDIVAGMGIVKLVFQTCGAEYYLEAGDSVDQEFDPDTEVLAFVKKVK